MDKIIKFPKIEENTIMCSECEIRPATRLCDYKIGYNIDYSGVGKVKEVLCDKPLCDKCTHKLNGNDYCKEHFKSIKEEINNEI